MDWLGAPDQGARTSPLRPLGRNGREIELTEECQPHFRRMDVYLLLPLHIPIYILFVWLVADGWC
jgi:hypothetical protein